MPRWTALALLAALLTGCAEEEASVPAGVPAEAPPPVSFAFESNASSGYLILRLEHAEGLKGEYVLEHAFDLNNFAPLQLVFLGSDGGIARNLPSFDFDASHLLRGDGVLYAGVGEHAVHSSNLSGQDLHANRHTALVPLQEREATLVLTWARQLAPVRLAIALEPGTRVEQVAQGDAVSAFEMRDFRQGARLGLHRAWVNQGDALELPAPEGQRFGYVTYIPFGQGRGQVVYEGESRHAISLDADVAGDCSRYDAGRALFTDSGPLRISLDYAGAGGSTFVFVVLADLPAGTLPAGLWSELLDMRGCY